MIPPPLGWSRQPGCCPGRSRRSSSSTIGGGGRHLVISLVEGLLSWQSIGTQRPATPHTFREQSLYFYNKLQGNQFRIKTEDEAKIGFQERNYLEDGRIVGNTTYNIQILNNISAQNGSIFPILSHEVYKIMHKSNIHMYVFKIVSLA